MDRNSNKIIIILMKLYHTYEKSNGFNLNKMNWNRGVFCVKAWWVNNPKFPEYNHLTAFEPNEFGDVVVELDVDDSPKTYQSSDQIDALIGLFGKNNEKVKGIIYKYEMGDFGERQEDWWKLDELIGKALKKKGYQLIHYTEDPMYGDTWAIIDPKIIKSIRHEND